jgi:hypothetical protein
MKKMNKKSAIYTLIIALAMFSCVDDEFDTPPGTTIPVGETITIQEVKDLYNAENSDYTFTNDQSIFAVVTMDDKSGNIYKTAYIQDQTGAIALHMDASGGLYEGDSIRIQLNGLKVGQYERLFQIDATDGNGFTMDKYITKLDTKVEKTPEEATILNILSGMDYYQCRLIKLNDVQFILSDTNKTYADGDNLVTENRTIEDQEGNSLIVRTSGYASFANEPVPNGSGSLVAIVGQYRNDVQLYIRSSEEIEMNNERLSGSGGEGTEIFYEAFSSDLGSFFQYSVTGSEAWEYSTTYECARISGFSGGANTNEDWLISSPLNLSSYSSATLTFRHAAGFPYGNMWNDLKAYISSDYTGSGNPNLASWTEVSFEEASTDPDWWIWTDSGNIDLSLFAGENNVYIGFVYNSNTSNAATWEIDNVKVVAQ